MVSLTCSITPPFWGIKSEGEFSSGTRNREPKPICSQSEAGIAGLGQRVPQYGGAATKWGDPVCSPWQIIDRRLAVTVEHRRREVQIECWGVSFEIDADQTPAARE